MADDQEIKFTLNLDSKEAVEGILKLKENVANLGESNLEGLVKGLTMVGTTAAVVGAAAFVLKEAFEMALEAEQIKSINQQFEMLTKNVGISTSALRSGLEDAAGGLVGDTELIQAANKAVVELGGNAARIPETLELARKVTSVFGGELTDRFQQINQAVATGNARLLRHIGLKVDEKKAYQEYAKSIGTSVDALSMAEKQQAMMNAVLEKGDKAFGGVTDSTRETTNAWKQFKVALKDLGETIVLVFDKLLGPAVRAVTKDLAAMAKMVKNTVKADFGDGAEAAAAKMDLLHERITSMKKLLSDMEARKVQLGFETNPGQIEATKKNIASLEKAYDSLKSKKEESESGGIGGNSPEEDKEKRLAHELEFNKRLGTLKGQRLQDDLKTADSLEEYDATQKAILEEAEADFNNQIQKLDQERSEGKLANDQEYFSLKEEMEAEHLNKLTLLEDDYDEKRIAALERLNEESQDVGHGITTAFQAGSAKASASLNDFGKMGQKTFDSVGKHASDAFMAIGSGSKNAGEAAKGFVFNVMADEAEGRGKLVLASSIWPPNPLGIAAGGGLMALAGFLRSQAGGGGGSGGGGGGASSGVGDSGAGFGTRTDSAPSLSDQQSKKSVTVNVQGDFLSSEQTQARLMEIVRQAGDMQDFNLNKLGP